jgi:hypothetical protein
MRILYNTSLLNVTGLLENYILPMYCPIIFPEYLVSSWSITWKSSRLLDKVFYIFNRSDMPLQLLVSSITLFLFRYNHRFFHCCQFFLTSSRINVFCFSYTSVQDVNMHRKIKIPPNCKEFSLGKMHYSTLLSHMTKLREPENRSAVVNCSHHSSQNFSVVTVRRNLHLT